MPGAAKGIYTSGWKVGCPNVPGWHALLRAIALLGILLVSKAIAGRNTYREDPTYLIDTWETEDGLPENTVTAMVQTPDGYLWFGTFGGLVRFDGVNFTVFNRANTSQLPNTGIVNLHLDRRGWLWISTIGGMEVLADNKWRTFGTNEGWVGDYVHSFTERTNGDLLFTTFDGKVLEFANGRLGKLPEPPGAPDSGYAGQVDEKGEWWVAQRRFIGCWDGHNWVQTLALTNAEADNQVCMTAARGGGIWLFTNNELRKYRNGTELSRLELPEPRIHVWSMFEDSRSNLWICTLDQGLRQVSSAGNVRSWTTTNGLSSESTRFVFEDRENDLWVGTSGGGLQRFKSRRIHSLVAAERSSASSVSAKSAGDVWVATYGQGLFRRNASGVTKIALPREAGERGYLQSVLEDRLGRVWVGTYLHGLCLLDKQGTRVFSSSRDTGGGNVIALFEDSLGHVWVSGGESASVYEGSSFRVFGPEDGLPHGSIDCFAEASNGEVWLAHQDGVFRFHQGRFSLMNDEAGHPLRDIACLLRDASGAMWMGSSTRGLIRWREGRVARVGAAAGLPPVAIYNIIEDHHAVWWMASDHGVMRVPLAELQAAADNPGARIHCEILDMSDGLPGTDFSTERQPMSTCDAAGRLWFAMSKGIALIDPEEFFVNEKTPPTHIEEVSYFVPSSGGTNGRQVQERTPSPEKLSLPPGSRRLEIHYSGLSFVTERKVRFQVKLEPGDADWQDAGGLRVADYYDLHPGDYVFRVRAANNDGVWNETGASLAFAVQPYYWQTGWFRVAMGLLLASIGGGVVFGSNRSKRRRELRELERVHRQSAIVAALSLDQAVAKGDLDAAFRMICEQVLAVVDVQRVSIWLIDEPGNELRCANAYDGLAGKHQPGMLMQLTRYPNWLEALRTNRTIEVAQARSDRRTSDFAADYLAPLGVSSLLAATVRLQGRLVGVVCYENTGPAREWHADEVSFAGAVADQVAQAISNVEREKATAELRETEARFRTVANAAPVMIWMSGTDKLCHFFNKGWLDFRGRTLEQELGNGWAEGVHPDDLAGCLKNYSESFDVRRPFTLEYRLLRHDGEYRWVSDNGVPRYDSDRDFLGYIGSCVDLTERKRADEKFRLAVEASPNGIVLVEQQGRIVLVNAQTERLFGYSREELIGHPVELLLPERLRSAHPGSRAGFLAAPQARAMGAGRELFALRKDGTQFPVEIGLSPIQSAEGLLVLTAIVDITARKQAEAEALLQRNELAHMARVSTMGELASSLAHELNQPLGAIMRNAEAAELFLQDPLPDLEEVRAILTDIRKDDQRAGAVIDRVRGLIKRREVERRPLDLNLLAGEVVTLVRPDAELRRVRLALETDPSLPPVQGDRVQLQQVLLNLVLNAMDALKDNPPASRLVTVGTRPAGERVEVAVSDTGHGISAENLPRLFEPFFTSKPNGLGLGLVISRSIIEAHGGKLWAENNPDGGATFHITLPVARGEERR
jgi:two-component system sensor kinase FixL